MYSLTGLVRLGHDIANVVVRLVTEYVADALGTLLSLGAQTRGVVLGLLAMANHVDGGFAGRDGGESQERERLHVGSVVGNDV